MVKLIQLFVLFVSYVTIISIVGALPLQKTQHKNIRFSTKRKLKDKDTTCIGAVAAHIPTRNLLVHLSADDLILHPDTAWKNRAVCESYAGTTIGSFVFPEGKPRVEKDQVNGHAAVEFTGKITAEASFTSSSNTFTLAMVVEQRSTLRNKVPYFIGDYYAHAPYTDCPTCDNSYVNWRDSVRSKSGVTVGAGKYFLLVWVEDGSKCVLYNNGALQVTFTGGNSPQLSNAKQIGFGNYKNRDPSSTIDGHIAEIFFYDKNLDAKDLELLHNYLFKMYMDTEQRDRISLKEVLNTGDALVSKNKRFKAIMQTDCNFVVYDTKLSDRPVFNTGTNGKGTNCYASIQEDGNLCVFDGANKKLWSSNKQATSNHKKPYSLVMQDDGDLIEYDSAAAVIYHTASHVRNKLNSKTDSALLPATMLISSNGRYSAWMQTDCNLVVYDYNVPSKPVVLWHSETYGKGQGCSLQLQDSDAHLVVYGSDGKTAIWSTGKLRKSGQPFILTMQDDGNFVETDNNDDVIFSTMPVASKSRCVTTTVKTTIPSLCAIPGTGSSTTYYGRECDSNGKILWIKMATTNPRPGLSTNQCQWNRNTTYPGNDKWIASYFGLKCGEFPSVVGDLEKQFKSLPLSNQVTNDQNCGISVTKPSLPPLVKDSCISISIPHSIPYLCSNTDGSTAIYYGTVCDSNGNVLWKRAETTNPRAGLSLNKCKWNRQNTNTDNLNWVNSYFGSACGNFPTAVPQLRQYLQLGGYKQVDNNLCVT